MANKDGGSAGSQWRKARNVVRASAGFSEDSFCDAEEEFSEDVLASLGEEALSSSTSDAAAREAAAQQKCDEILAWAARRPWQDESAASVRPHAQHMCLRMPCTRPMHARRMLRHAERMPNACLTVACRARA